MCTFAQNVVKLLRRNLAYLRKKFNLSQSEVAGLFHVSRSAWSNYENGKNEPSIFLLKSMCTHFNININTFINEDLESSEGKSGNHDRATPLATVTIVTVDDNQKQNIELVPVKAIAGYAQNFSNVQYVKELERFSIPKLNEGTYRAFEVQGDSMLPIKQGYVVIGRYMEDFRFLKVSRSYVIISKEHGVTFKRVFRDKQDNGKLILVSDNPEFSPFQLSLEDIFEMWEVVAFIGYGDRIENDTSFLLQKVSMIEQKLDHLVNPKTLRHE